MEEESTVASLGIQRQIPRHSEQKSSHGTRRRNRVRQNYTGRKTKQSTRMQSSRMRTARWLPYGGVSVQRPGGLWGVSLTETPLCEQNHRRL